MMHQISIDTDTAQQLIDHLFPCVGGNETLEDFRHNLQHVVISDRLEHEAGALLMALRDLWTFSSVIGGEDTEASQAAFDRARELLDRFEDLE